MLWYEEVNVIDQYRPNGSTAQAISASVETAIRQGTLQPGDRLVSVRDLATDLGVSPNTVAAAYRHLGDRGLVVGAGRRGTHVAPRPPVPTTVVTQVRAGLVDLATGNPDPELLPPLPRVRRSVASSPPVDATGVIDLPELVALAGDRFRSAGLEGGDALVLGGALDAIERVLGANLRPGDRVVVEDPGFPPLVDLLRAMGLEPVGVAIDDLGLVPSQLTMPLSRGAAAVVITPRAQNPTGAALDERRAADLADVLSSRPGVLVVEDDHAGPVAGAAPVSVCAFLAGHPWAVVASVSKWLGPDLRVAVMTGDAETLGRVAGRRAVGAGWVSTLLQGLVVDLWSSAEVMTIVDTAADTYRHRRESLIAALADSGVEATGRSGLNVWVPLRHEAPALAACRDAGFEVSAGERFRLAAGCGIRISTGLLRAEHVAPLARAIGSVAGRSRRSQQQRALVR